jgi:hypothetical protein
VGWEGVVSMRSGGSKKTSQHFFLESPGAEKVEKKKSNCANYLCPSWLAQGEERTENQQPSTGLCIQMVRSWVLVYAGPVNHPLQGYYNLVADETPVPTENWCCVSPGQPPLLKKGHACS